MSVTYTLQEYKHCVLSGGRLGMALPLVESKGERRHSWPVVLEVPLLGSPDLVLHLRYNWKRPERAHLVLQLRDKWIVRMDTYDGHSERGVLREGTHLHKRPDALDRRGTVSFEIDPPLVGFPEDIQAGDMVRYWVPLEWFCSHLKIDPAAIDRASLEEEAQL